jgi:hypothetical protein
MVDISKLPKYSAVDGVLELRENGEFVNVNDLTAALQSVVVTDSTAALALAQASVIALTSELDAIKAVFK